MSEDIRDLSTALYEEYGIKLSNTEINEEELKKRGFARLSEESLVRGSIIAGTFPGRMIDALKRQDVNKQVQEALKNTYHCIILKDGNTHLTSSKRIPGAVTSQVRNEKNQLVDEAVWKKAQISKIQPSAIFDLAETIMNIAAYSIGQYFMVQINGKLADIQDGIQDVMRFLDNEKISELEAAYDELLELYEHIEYIKNNDKRCDSSIERLNQTIHVARKDMHFFKRQIKEIEALATGHDKREDVKERVQSMIQALSRYRLALVLFCEAKMMETYLSDINDIGELTVFRDEIERGTKTFIEDYQNAREWCNKYMVAHRIIGSANRMEFIPSIDEFLKPEEKENNKQKKYVGMTDQMLNRFAVDPDDLYRPIRGMNNYIAMLKDDKELYIVEDSVYTKAPMIAE